MHNVSENSHARPARLGLWPRFAGPIGLAAALLCALLPSVGCFNADALIEARRMIAMRTRLEEIDLGKFRVTLPHAAERTESAELHFHVFGQVANRDLGKVKAALKKYKPEIRHRMLIAARLMTVEQLEDPQLTALRQSIAEVLNESLEGDLVQSIGFYRFGYMNH